MILNLVQAHGARMLVIIEAPTLRSSAVAAWKRHVEDIHGQVGAGRLQRHAEALGRSFRQSSEDNVV